MNFTDTRARTTDSDTSHKAAKNAASKKCDLERLEIRRCIFVHSLLSLPKKGMTAREIADWTKIDYITVQRRISECGLTKTDAVRDGCRVWTL